MNNLRLAGSSQPVTSAAYMESGFHPDSPPNTSVLSLAGDICSVLGLIITAFVFVKVRGIQRGFLVQARLPILRKKMRGHCAAFSKMLNDFSPDNPDLEPEIRRCNANLDNLSPKLDGSQATNVQRTKTFTSELLKQHAPVDKVQIRKLHAALVGIEEELGNLTDDMQWRER